MSELCLAVRCPHGTHYSVMSLARPKRVGDVRELLGDVWPDSVVTLVTSESVRDGTLPFGHCAKCCRQEVKVTHA